MTIAAQARRMTIAGPHKEILNHPVTIQPQSMAPFPQKLEISLIHNAEFIMLNDFAKPTDEAKFSEYDISLCIHQYALCINE